MGGVSRPENPMPTPIPPTNYDESPTRCIRINQEWIPIMLGAMHTWLNPPQWGIAENVFMINPKPIWEGDENAQFDAEQQILFIMEALMLGNCEETVTTIPPGTTMDYAGTTAPDGWLLCDGAEYLKADYPALWDILAQNGAIFEADTTHFLVPDLRGRVTVGAGEGAGLTNRLIGQFDGFETHLLEINELPEHTHVQDAHNHLQDAHNHLQDAHNHLQDAHNHTQNAHGHTTSPHTHIQDPHNHLQDAHNHTQNAHGHGDPNHVHPIAVAVFAGAFGDKAPALSNTNANGLFNTNSASTGLQAATATNQATTATNQATTATNQLTTVAVGTTTAANQATTATNQAATATNQAATAANQETTATNQPTGGDQPHNNMPPFFVLNKIIKT